MENEIRDFFYNSEQLDYMVLRPLSHLNGDWELLWDEQNERYEQDGNTFANLLNELIEEIAKTTPPKNYHHYEDSLIELAKKKLNWNIQKDAGRWTVKDYRAPLVEGAYFDFKQEKLIQAASGRIQAAIARGQTEYDTMDNGHQFILSVVMSIIVFQRATSTE